MTTVVLVAMILSLTTFGLLVARSDLLLFRNLRDAQSTYYRTHAAIAQNLAELNAGYAFDSVLVGPDGVSGTADDGAVAAVSGCRVQATDDRDDPDSSSHVDGNQRIRFVAECSGPRNARSAVESIVGRRPAPFVPAALYLERIDLDLSAPVTLDGADHPPGDLPDLGSGTGGFVPAAASPALQAPIGLPLEVKSESGAPVVVRPTARIETSVLSSNLTTVVPQPLTSVPQGEFGQAFIHVSGDSRVIYPSTGTGLLVVAGQLDIQTPVDFSGVVVVGGSLRVGATGALSVKGMLWVRGEGPGPAISTEGPLSVVYSSQAISEVDGVLRLPRRAVLLAEREIL